MFDLESAIVQQAFQTFDGVFIAVLGMNAFTLTKTQCHVECIYPDGLRNNAFEVQFYARCCLIPERYMGEGVRFEVAAEFAVNPDEKVFIERSGYACAVVIRRVQDPAIFYQICPKQELISPG